MKSKFLTLQVRDFLWGLFYAMVPAMTPIYKIFTAGEFPGCDVWFSSIMKAIPVLLIYVSVHFLKNNRGEFLKGDEK
jgi:hypothetical protein